MEFELIQRIRARSALRPDVLLGIGDDAALLRMPPDQCLVLSTDTLNAGVHFPPDTAPADIGWKALAVNLSDLAAMAAEPAWCTLSLSLPDADADWLDAFLDGFMDMAVMHRVALVGGDTTRGPLSITVCVQGWAPETEALRRDGARAGDEIWISGVTGEAAGALMQWRAGVEIDPQLRARLDRPEPRVTLGLALRGLASACIDVSDGLIADLGHILRASGTGAEVNLEALPGSSALARHFDPDTCAQLQLSGGDDYELCFVAPAQRQQEIRTALDSIDATATRIGRMIAGGELRLVDAQGRHRPHTASGWDHFSGGAA